MHYVCRMQSGHVCPHLRVSLPYVSIQSYYIPTYKDFQIADAAQQAFSSERLPTLYNTIPALEKMYSKWEKLRETPEAEPFRPALDVALAKVNEYYEKTAESDVHIMAMHMIFCLFNI